MAVEVLVTSSFLSHSLFSLYILMYIFILIPVTNMFVSLFVSICVTSLSACFPNTHTHTSACFHRGVYDLVRLFFPAMGWLLSPFWSQQLMKAAENTGAGSCWLKWACPVRSGSACWQVPSAVPDKSTALVTKSLNDVSYFVWLWLVTGRNTELIL